MIFKRLSTNQTTPMYNLYRDDLSVRTYFATKPRKAKDEVLRTNVEMPKESNSTVYFITEEKYELVAYEPYEFKQMKIHSPLYTDMDALIVDFKCKKIGNKDCVYTLFIAEWFD